MQNEVVVDIGGGAARQAPEKNLDVPYIQSTKTLPILGAVQILDPLTQLEMLAQSTDLVLHLILMGIEWCW